MDLDLQKLVGWDQAARHWTIIALHSKGLNSEYIGGGVDSQENYAPFNLVRFLNLTLKQRFSQQHDNDLNVIVGRMGALPYLAQLELTCQFMNYAVGQLNRPMAPQIAGQEAFKKSQFHSAAWDHSIDWQHKRVAVIGTGASTVQFIQQLVNMAGHVDIFTRTPNWLLPSSDLNETVTADKRWLLENLPTYNLWYRASLAIPQSVGLFDEIKLDATYPRPSTRYRHSTANCARPSRTGFAPRSLSGPTWKAS